MASGWLQPAAMCAAGVLALSGFGAVWVPVPAYPPDLSRYVAAIEGEVQGQELSRVLIDHGSWLYMAKGIVMKDRMAPIGDAGYAGTGDFSGIIGRIEARYYTKILVHDFDGKDFRVRPLSVAEVFRNPASVENSLFHRSHHSWDRGLNSTVVQDDQRPRATCD